MSQKITDMTSGNALDGTELFESVQGSSTRKQTALQMKTYVQSNLDSVVITGGTIDGTAIGGTTKAAASFTALTATGTTTLDTALTGGLEATSGVVSAFTLTAAGKALIDDASASAQRATLGVTIGTDVQAFDATLTSIALLGTAADKMLYTTGIDTWAEADITAAGRALIDDASASAQRTTLGVAIGSDVQAYDARLDDISGLSVTDGNFIVGNGSNFISETASTALTSIGGIGAATTDTLTNKTFDANGTGNSLSNVDVADLANGTDGELITWDASANPATVAVGTSGHVLTSNGAGAAPTFQAVGTGLSKVYFHATAGTTNQSITSSITKVNFGTELEDSGTVFGSSTFTAPRAGTYQFHTTVTIDAAAAVNLEGGFRLNGAGSVLSGSMTSLTAATVRGAISPSIIITLAINDTIEVYAAVSTTSNTDAANTVTGLVNFSGHNID